MCFAVKFKKHILETKKKDLIDLSMEHCFIVPYLWNPALCAEGQAVQVFLSAPQQEPGNPANILETQTHMFLAEVFCKLN